MNFIRGSTGYLFESDGHDFSNWRSRVYRALAGRNPTRQKLIDAINSISDWTADGIQGPIDWHVAHHANNPTDCDAYLQVQNGKFTPLFHQPFVCYPHNSPTVPDV